LDLKTRTKQLLGSYPLAFTLTNLTWCCLCGEAREY